MNDSRATEPRAHCTAAADGTVTWLLDLPPATAPRLILTRRGAKHGPTPEAPDDELTLDVFPGPEGRWQAVQPPQPHLAEGRWDTWATLGDDGPRHRLRPGLRDLRQLTDGGSRNRTSPVAVRVPYATKDGYLAVRAWLRTAHAEADVVIATPAAMTVRARLHGTTTGPGAVAVLRERGDGRLRTVEPTHDEGPDLEFTVDYRALLEGEAPGGRIWDVFVRPRRDARRVRVSRLLDDLADRKSVSVYPAAPVAGGSVQPYFTVDNDLAIKAAEAPAGER